MSITVKAPVCGTIIDLHHVGDPVFAEEMMGGGIAICPSDDDCSAVCDARPAGSLSPDVDQLMSEGEGDLGKPSCVRCPISGTIIKALPHAFIVQSDCIDSGGQPAVLVHCGINTVSIPQGHFNLLVREGDHVDQSTVGITWNPHALKQRFGVDVTVVVVAVEQPSSSLTIDLHEGAAVNAGDPLFEVR